MHNFVLHIAAAVRRSRSGQVASGREPLPLLRTRRRAGQQVGAHPHRARPVTARDRLQVLPHRGKEGSRFPETAASPRLLNAMRSDAAVGGGGAGSGGPTMTCRGAPPRNWNSAEAPRWELKIGCMLIQNVPMTHNPYTIYT